VDVRTPAEFSAGSVKGAVNIPLDKSAKANYPKFKNKKSIVFFAEVEAVADRQKHFGTKRFSECNQWRNVAKCKSGSK